jgi:signal transduction histidine kinase
VRGISSRPDDPGRHQRWRVRGQLDPAWGTLSLLNLTAIAIWPSWDTVPFHLIAIGFTLLYALRIWPTDPMLWGISIVTITTLTGLALDVLRDARSVEEAAEVPLMATMFVALVWHANRRITADYERQSIAEKNARLLDAQRQLMQDASHHLRTPITIALTYAELLARELTGPQELRDVEMVVGEMNRLRRLSDRLLVIAASEDPEFLRPEPIDLEKFAVEVIERWRPTAQRQWELGRLDAATVMADPERLGLAVDALLENAVKYTFKGDVIKLSVVADRCEASVVITDAGSGIADSELSSVFDRFRTGSKVRGTRGTGLGLAVVRAVANAHGGSVTVRSALGEGSEFQILLPVAADAHFADAG